LLLSQDKPPAAAVSMVPVATLLRENR